MKDLLGNVLFISIFLVQTGYYLYCFKKGKYGAIKIWGTKPKEKMTSTIMVICLVISMIILQPTNINNYVIVITFGIYLVVLNILSILIFSKTKKNNFGKLIFFDIFMAILLYFILK